MIRGGMEGWGFDGGTKVIRCRRCSNLVRDGEPAELDGSLSNLDGYRKRLLSGGEIDAETSAPPGVICDDCANPGDGQDQRLDQFSAGA